MSAKKTALGRGLGALLQNVESPAEEIKELKTMGSVAAGIDFIPIDQIETNPFQPRKEFDEEALSELAESIKEQGIITPVTVRKVTNNRYQLIAGERRLRASKALNLKEIPAYIRVATDVQVLEMALVENIQRENLNAIEIALSYEALINDCNLTQEKLSQRVGKNRSTITNYLRLLKLPAEIQIALNNEKISMAHARAMINIEDPEKQLYMLHQTIEKDLSVRSVEALVKNLNNPKIVAKTEKAKLPEHYVAFQNDFSQKIGSSVEIRRNKRGRGVISISFENEKDFERLSGLLNINE